MRRTELLEQVQKFPTSAFKAPVWRATRRGLKPDTPSTSGGRWMLPDVCPVLYASLSEEGALAEMAYRQSLLNPMPTKPVLIHTLQVSLARVARLTHDDLHALGIVSGTYHEPDYSRTQEIGDAVWFLERDGLIVPSARWKCDNLVIFFDKLSSPEISVSVVHSEEVDWIRWAKENGIRIPEAD